MARLGTAKVSLEGGTFYSRVNNRSLRANFDLHFISLCAGVWDGIGGILKNHLRQVNIRFLAWDPHSTDKPNPILADGGRILTAKHVYQQLDGHFGSDKWRENAELKSKAITRFVFHWADEKDIARHPNPPTYERIDGITRSYQYMMLKNGEVLTRRHSCWCLHCLRCAMAGPDALTTSYEVEGCARGVADKALYEYTNSNCRIKDGPGVGVADKRARDRGHELATHLEPGGGQWVLVEAYDEDEDGDVLWLAKTVPAERFSGECCRRMTSKTTLHENESRSTSFDAGDHAIALEWYERVPDDRDRLTFTRGDRALCFVNSTELRHIVPFHGVAADLHTPAWHLGRLEEAHAQDWCR